MALLTAVPSFVLFVAAFVAVAANSGGFLQYCATVMLGSGLLYYAARLILLRSRIAARELLKATIIYLPFQYLILVLGNAGVSNSP
jgi:heme O synthase-like polyprenyltransferase